MRPGTVRSPAPDERQGWCTWLRSLCSASLRRTLSCVFSASPPPATKSMLRRWDGASEGVRPTWHAGSAQLGTTYVSSARSAQTQWATISWQNSNSAVSIPSTHSVPTLRPHAPSYCLILLDDTGERTIIAVDSGAGPSSFLPIRGPDLRSVDCVYVEGYTRYPTGTAAAAESALLVTSPPVRGATTWPATVVVGSETQYTDVTSAGMFEAVRSVSGERLTWVVVTRGREGADAYAASTEVHVDAVAADQIDATGAGDAFTVGLLHGLLQGDDMLTALQLGAAWGAATVAQWRSIPVPWEELAGPFH